MVFPLDKKHKFQATVCVVVVVVFALTFSLGLTLRERGVHKKNNPQDSELSGRTLVFDIEFENIQANPGAIILDLIIKEEEHSPCSDITLSACTDVNIFTDNNLLDQDGRGQRTVNNNRPSEPIFYFNATALAISDTLNNSPIFRTTITLTQYDWDPHHYPFDSYFAIVFFFAQEIQSNKSVAVKIGHIGGIIGGYTTTEKHENIIDHDTQQGAIRIVLTVSRGPLVKLYAIIIVIANWIMSLVLLTLTIQTVLFRYPQNGEVLLAPAATLFAFSSLRGTMPGVPPFGTFIDYVAYLPCLGILAVSASLTAGVYIFRDPTDRDVSLASPSPATVATRRYMEVSSAASDAIAHQVAVDSYSVDKLRVVGAAMKAAAAAHRAINAAHQTIDISLQILGSRTNMTAYREEVKRISQKAGQQQSWDKLTVSQAADMAKDAAGAAREAADVAGNVAHSTTDATKVMLVVCNIDSLVAASVQRYSDALNAAGDAYNHHAEALSAVYKGHAIEIQSATWKAVIAAHRAIELARKTVDAAEEAVGSVTVRTYRLEVEDAAEMLTQELAIQAADGEQYGDHPFKHPITAESAVGFARIAERAARSAAYLARHGVPSAKSTRGNILT